MDYYGASEQIKKGNLAPIYLIHGEESYFSQQLEKAIIAKVLPAEDRDTNVFTFDSDPEVQHLQNAVESIPFMGGKNVIVVRDTKLFRAQQREDNANEDQRETASDEVLLKLFSNIPDYTHVLLFTTQKVDKRRKLYKAIDKCGAVIAVEPIKAKDLRSWLLHKLSELHKKMSQQALEHLMTATGFMPQISISFLDNEMEKLALYVGERTTIEYQDLVSILSPIPEISIFALIDAMGQKQLSLALKLLQEQLADGEHPLKIIALLARQVRLLYQVREATKEGLTSRQVAESLKLHPFVAEKLQKQGRGFTEPKLRQALVSLAQIDVAFKSGNTGPDALELFIINMCK